MSEYRPITDVWILARSKVKYYGAFPAGFLSRARALLGVGSDDCVLHLCAGKVREYPFAGLGDNDFLVDLDETMPVDYVHDVRHAFPGSCPLKNGDRRVEAVLADPPYTEEDADHYAAKRSALPTTTDLFARADEVLAVGCRIGILHYLWPRPPKNFKNIAVVSVLVGFNNRGRLYSVYEKAQT